MPFDRENIAVVSCVGNPNQVTPTEVPLNFPSGILRGYEIVIPAGHSGLTGIGLGYAHGIAIPDNQPGYYSGDDDVIRRSYRDKVPGVPWSAFLINLDLQSHVWEVRFMFDEISGLIPPIQAPTLTPQDIIDAGVEAMSGG